MRIFPNFLLFSVLILCVVSYLSTATKSPLQSHQLSDSYIVILKDNLSAPATNDHLLWVRNLHSTRENLRLELRKRGQEPQVFAGVQHTYTISGNPIGYSGHFDAGLIEEIRKSPDVNFIEKDFEHHFLQGEELEPVTQKGAPWNLARISHRDAYVISQFYIYSSKCGEGVDAYVIDTGIYSSHLDFEDRAFSSANFQPDESDGDIYGHGTHCAGFWRGRYLELRSAREYFP
jgi:cerevisin